jgi:hypothetical protein
MSHFVPFVVAGAGAPDALMIQQEKAAVHLAFDKTIFARD